MAELIDRDQEHLRLLKLCYYVVAGMTTVYSLFSMIFLIAGSLLFSAAIPLAQARSKVDPHAFGLLFLGIAIAAILAALGTALATFLTARYLRDHRRRTFCIVMAACTCIYIPWGTIIGVCTIMVLNRPSVKALFGDSEPQPAALGTP